MKKFAALIIFIVALILLTATVCPNIYVGDDGELNAAAYTLGVGHPPGYPVFTMLAHLSTYLPLANIAFRINLLSVLLGALSVLLLFHVTLRLLAGEKYMLYGSIFAASAFLFSETFWAQALHSKGGIYTLNIFLMLGMILCVFNNRAYLMGLIAGLGLANHHTIMMAFPGLFVMIYFLRKEWLKPSHLFKILCFTGLGVLSYLYLMISAANKPIMNWGQPYNFERLLYHIKRGQYGDITNRAYSFGGFLEMSMVYAKWLVNEFTFFVLPLVILGIYAFYKKDRKMFWTFMVFLLTSTLGLMYVLNYEINPRNVYVNVVFFIPAFAFTALLAGFGCTFLAKKLKYSFVFVPLLLLAPLMTNSKVNDLSANHTAYNYGVNILKTMEKDAVFFCEGDNQMFVLGYLQYAGKLRPDVKIYDDLGIVFENIYGENFLRISRRERDLIRNKLYREIALKTSRPLYIPLIGSKESLFQDFKKEQNGILVKLTKEPAGRVKNLLSGYNLSGIEKPQADYLLRDVIAQYYYASGAYYLQAGDKQAAIKEYERCGLVGFDSEWVPNNLGVVFMNMGEKERAIKYTESSVKNSPSSARDYTNMGVIYYQQGDYDKAIEYYKKALSFNANYSEAYNGLGTVYAMKKMKEEAIRAYETAILLKPDYSEPLANLGILYHQQNNLPKAIEYYSRALTVNPGSADAHNNLGVAYETQKNIDGALAEYKKAVELDYTKTDSHHNIGVIYYRKGLYTEAEREWEIVLKQRPDYLRVNENLKLVRKALNK